MMTKDKVVIDGVEVKVGDKVAVTEWLTFRYFITKIFSKSKIQVSFGLGNAPVTLTRGRKGGFWHMAYDRSRKCRIDFNPDWKAVNEHNDRIERSETWMCM